MNEKGSAKIRLARLRSIFVLGAKEVADGTVSIRHRDHEELATITLAEFTGKSPPRSACAGCETAWR